MKINVDKIVLVNKIQFKPEHRFQVQVELKYLQMELSAQLRSLGISSAPISRKTFVPLACDCYPWLSPRKFQCYTF